MPVRNLPRDLIGTRLLHVSDPHIDPHIGPQVGHLTLRRARVGFNGTLPLSEDTDAALD